MPDVRQDEDQLRSGVRAWMDECARASTDRQTEDLLTRAAALWGRLLAVDFHERDALMLLGPGLDFLGRLRVVPPSSADASGGLLEAWRAFNAGETMVWVRDEP